MLGWQRLAVRRISPPSNLESWCGFPARSARCPLLRSILCVFGTGPARASYQQCAVISSRRQRILEMACFSPSQQCRRRLRNMKEKHMSKPSHIAYVVKEVKGRQEAELLARGRSRLAAQKRRRLRRCDPRSDQRHRPDHLHRPQSR
jgi:hypothetical protein